MYHTILVTLDGTPTDRAIIEHIKKLATLAHSRLVLLHVADGWAARTYGPDAISPEIADDLAYLERVRSEFEAAGIPADTIKPVDEPRDGAQNFQAYVCGGVRMKQRDVNAPAKNDVETFPVKDH